MTPPSPEAVSERVERALVALDEASWWSDDEKALAILTRLERQSMIAALEKVAKRQCYYCKEIGEPMSEPIYTDKPQPVRRFHRPDGEPDHACSIRAAWDEIASLRAQEGE